MGISLMGLTVLIVGVLWVAGAAGLIAGGIVLIRRRNRAGGIALAVTGAVMVLAPAAWVAWLFMGPSMHDTLASTGPDTSGTSFAATVRHERLAYDGVDTVFRYGAGADALHAELEEDYPGGWLEGDTWMVELDGVVYAVAPSPGLDGGPVDPHTYALTVHGTDS